MLASGVERGDEVITTPFSFIASANSILYCGAIPVFVDVDANTNNINPSLVTEKITSKTKAILVVHLYGQPCDMKEIVKICHEYGLVLIEDACQAHGAEYDGKKVGSFGIGCFSFYPTKNMTTGEGGIITTDNKVIAHNASMIRNHGQKAKYLHSVLGFNYRMTDIAAALGICQLKKLDEFNEKRIHNAMYLIKEIREIHGLITPVIAPNRKHVFHQFTVRVTIDYKLSRGELCQKLAENGIGSAVHYPIPIHKQPYYAKLGYDSDCLPVAERAAEEVLSLPVHPDLRESDLEIIVEGLRNA